MNTSLKKVALSAILMLAAGTVSASGFEGTITWYRINTVGPSPARMSVMVGAHGSPCTQASWFSYENADTGLGKLWTAMIMQAYLSGKKINIQGNGVCDAFAVEGVDTIDLK